MSRPERRRQSAYKLRVYLDGIKQATGMTDEQWADNYAANALPGTEWKTRTQWLDYLRTCAIQESERLTTALEAA